MYKVIVADDEAVIRNRLIKHIKWAELGFVVVDSARDGEELIEKCLKHKPDLVVTDICMPGVDGIDFAEKIRKLGIKTEIIVFSGYSEFEYARRLIEFDVMAYLLKPIDMDKLCEAIKKAYDKLELRTASVAYTSLKQICDQTAENIMRDIGSGRCDRIDSYLMEFEDELTGNAMEFSEIKNQYFILLNTLYRNLIELKANVGNVKNVFKGVFDDWSDIDGGDELRRYVSNLIIGIIQLMNGAEDDIADMYFNNAVKFIDEHYMEDISLKDVADYLEISGGYLSVILNDKGKAGFVKLLRYKRIDKAKEFLLNTNMKVYEIAYILNFANPRYFSEVFRAETGLNPLDYRKKFKK